MSDQTNQPTLEDRVASLERREVALYKYVTGAMKEVLEGILDASNELKEASKGAGLGAAEDTEDASEGGHIQWQSPNRDPALDTIDGLFLVYAVNHNGEGDYVISYYNCGRFYAQWASKDYFEDEPMEPVAWAHLVAP